MKPKTFLINNKIKSIPTRIEVVENHNLLKSKMKPNIFSKVIIKIKTINTSIKN